MAKYIQKENIEDDDIIQFSNDEVIIDFVDSQTVMISDLWDGKEYVGDIIAMKTFEIGGSTIENYGIEIESVGNYIIRIIKENGYGSRLLDFVQL